MKIKRENEKDEERKKKSDIIISPHTVKTIMFTRTKLQIASTRYTSSLSFSSPNHSKYLTYLTKKFRDNVHNPHKGFHLLRIFSQTNHFLPKYSLQTRSVYKVHPYELPKLIEHKFASRTTSRNLSIFPVNKLTMLFTRVLNLRVTPFTGEGRTLKFKKLTSKFIGPYQIIGRIGPVVYKIALSPPLANIHIIFHVSQRRKYVPDPSHFLEFDSIHVKENLSFEVKPIRILDS